MHHVLDQCRTIYPTLFISKDSQGNVYGIENIEQDLNSTPQKKANFGHSSNQEPIILENVKLCK